MRSSQRSGLPAVVDGARASNCSDKGTDSGSTLDQPERCQRTHRFLHGHRAGAVLRHELAVRRQSRTRRLGRNPRL